MTLLPIHTVRRLYDDHTLAVIEDLLGGTPFDQASDPIATQSLDPRSWRSMYKGPLLLTGTVQAEQKWTLARAIAYDRYLPTVVLARAQKMQEAFGKAGPLEVVYFPDAVGILHCHGLSFHTEDHSPLPEARMCLVIRDIKSPRDFLRRDDPFQRTLSRWLDRLHAASMPCTGLKLPRIEDLARTACGEPLELS